MDTPNPEALERLVAILKDALTDADLTSIVVEQDDFRLALEKEPPRPVAPVPTYAPAPPPPAAAPVGVGPAAGAAVVEEPGTTLVKSPMVGTFYRSPTPESEPYVVVGSTVKAESVVCIIEAMKVMNEIQAETGGTVIEVLVENGTPVEYGQPLFKVRN